MGYFLPPRRCEGVAAPLKEQGSAMYLILDFWPLANIKPLMVLLSY